MDPVFNFFIFVTFQMKVTKLNPLSRRFLSAINYKILPSTHFSGATKGFFCRRQIVFLRFHLETVKNNPTDPVNPV